MRICLLIVLLAAITSCKDKKKTSEGNEPLTFEQFAETYPVLKLPFAVADSNLDAAADTTTISRDVFIKFVPDSVITNAFPQNAKVSIHPIGRIVANEKETYLPTYITSKQKGILYLIVFNQKKYSTSMQLLSNADDEETNTVSIDKKYSIIINKEWNKNNELMYNRTIYAYNNVGVFTTVLTETNEKPVTSSNTVINPLDTFPKKNKYSGDYMKGKKNFLSIRDGKNPNEYRFFVHFANDDEEKPCGGDLKGELKMTSDKAGVYNQGSDPCIIDFAFDKNIVKVKEQGSCGNYRGITCFFNDTYTRKKETKTDNKKK
jgi:hypothetical protein